jgi:hypothetical protein
LTLETGIANVGNHPHYLPRSVLETDPLADRDEFAN